jgi:hypothetical protein
MLFQRIYALFPGFFFFLVGFAASLDKPEVRMASGGKQFRALALIIQIKSATIRWPLNIRIQQKLRGLFGKPCFAQTFRPGQYPCVMQGSLVERLPENTLCFVMPDK